MKFTLVPQYRVGSPLRQFSFEPSPDSLLIVVVLLEEQAEGFFRTKLGNSCEILHTEAI
ncbi:MAG: hypothetical protein WAK21_14135 [Candidatus Sulfotelmatobacter sp.]